MAVEKYILIADDNQVVHESLGIYLTEENYKFDSAYDGETALNMASKKNYDLIILDIMMPILSGVDVCREIRKTSDVPIIMLTAKGEELDRVLGLELGADDYIVKPFSPREVVARIKAVLRRINSKSKNKSKSQNLVSLPGLEINVDNYDVKVDGENVPFTPKEVEILYLLTSHPGQVLERGQIIEDVWGYDHFAESRTIDTHIKKIRQKIGTSDSWALVTVYGVGYKFEVHVD